MSYNYTSASNKLASIADNGTNPGTGNFYTASAYNYDQNGNLTTDSGKGISSTTYNHLNLPLVIQRSGGQIKFTYTGSGQKLRAEYPPNGLDPARIYDYVAGMVYTTLGTASTASLEFIPTAEGRALAPLQAANLVALGTNAPVGTKNKFYRYEYQLKDHLGGATYR